MAPLPNVLPLPKVLFPPDGDCPTPPGDVGGFDGLALGDPSPDALNKVEGEAFVEPKVDPLPKVVPLPNLGALVGLSTF